MVRPELDLFCQMPVVSVVSTPSTKTCACPASQHCSPSVPIKAMPVPLKASVAGNAALVMEVVVLVALAHAVVVAGVPDGFNPASAKASAYPPLVCHTVMVP